jgi:hypothetical protein
MSPGSKQTNSECGAFHKNNWSLQQVGGPTVEVAWVNLTSTAHKFYLKKKKEETGCTPVLPALKRQR